LAEKTYDFPWNPTSRSYNIAKRIIEEVQKGEKGQIPKDRSSQKEYFTSLAKEYGVTRHTIANIMHVLRSTQRILLVLSEVQFRPLGRIRPPCGRT